MTQQGPACEQFLEDWICNEPDPNRQPVPEHLHDCSHCQDQVAGFQRDQRALAQHFAAVRVPRPPAPLAPRSALQAASGYPRRVSLNVLPFLLLLLLVFLLMAGAAVWLILRHTAP